MGTGHHLHWAPNGTRYFYSRNGQLISKYAWYTREQIISMAAGATWSVSPNGETAFVAEPETPSAPARLIWVDVVTRLADEPNEQEMTPALAALLAQEILQGSIGQIVGDVLRPVGASADNNQLLFQRTKARNTAAAFVESDYEAVRATGLGQMLVSNAWIQGDPIPDSDPVQYEREQVMEHPRWDNDMSILFECNSGMICRGVPTDGGLIVDPLSDNNPVVAEARL